MWRYLLFVVYKWLFLVIPITLQIKFYVHSWEFVWNERYTKEGVCVEELGYRGKFFQ